MGVSPPFPSPGSKKVLDFKEIWYNKKYKEMKWKQDDQIREQLNLIKKKIIISKKNRKKRKIYRKKK